MLYAGATAEDDDDLLAGVSLDSWGEATGA
jgi:hypothetical protein